MNENQLSRFYKPLNTPEKELNPSEMGCGDPYCKTKTKKLAIKIVK